MLNQNELKQKKAKLKILVDNFDRGGLNYDETNTRVEFIDKFFMLLDWDVNNEAGYIGEYKEVEREDSVKVRGKIKKPDYAFRIGGTTKFYVEAKQPSVDIEKDPSPALQVRRYAYSKRLSISILTDFQEFAIYQGDMQVKEADKSHVGRLYYCKYTEFEKEFETIYNWISKEAILKGSFDKYNKVKRVSKGSSTIDEDFLKDIQKWRKSLAEDIAKRNKENVLKEYHINNAVQKILDRLIFLRMAEDRGAEDYGTLEKIAKIQKNIYLNLEKLFFQANKKYNSGLFAPEKYISELIISDNKLAEIIEEMYTPKSPYAFNVISIEILGSIYEQFLGDTIRLTNAGAKVETKPEVAKANGVYYTPQYIVNYIIKKTIGHKIKAKTPQEISSITICDPACGSGSFLIGAYNYILNYYLIYYTQDDKRLKNSLKNGVIYPVSKDDYRLTIQTKKEILLNNIYGLDIDAQAVEVTKLSLLLKLMEDEDQESMGELFKHSDEHILPDLGSNIKCGNSIVGTDVFHKSSINLFGDDEIQKLNPFDWEDGFKKIFSNGGFDCIIGNPPYRREKDFKYLLDEIKLSDFGAKYRVKRMDLWYYFVHLGIEKLKNNGSLSFIVNAYWLNGEGANKLIQHIKETTNIEEIYFLGKLKIFKNVSGQHLIFKITKNKSTDKSTTNIKYITDKDNFDIEKQGYIEYKKQKSILFNGNKINIEKSIEKDFFKNVSKLSELGIVRQGLVERPHIIDKKINKKFNNQFNIGEGVFKITLEELNKLKLSLDEMNIIKPHYDLTDIDRFYVSKNSSNYLIYTSKITCPDINIFPKIKTHLSKYKKILKTLRSEDGNPNYWWLLHRARDQSLMENEKIIFIQMKQRPSCVFVDKNSYVSSHMNLFIKNSDTREDYKYIMAILNSELLWYWFSQNAKKRGVGLDITGTVLKQAPIKKINFENESEKKLHIELINLSDLMMNEQQKLREAISEQDKKLINQKIIGIDKQIDNLIYILYNIALTEQNEIKEFLFSKK